MKAVIFNALRSSCALIFACVTLLVNNSDIPEKDNYLEPVSTTTYTLVDAFFHGQGITTDGEYYYFSSNIGLLKTELDGETVVEQNLIALPSELMLLGCNHIGGISYYDGKIYATTEDSGSFEHLYMIAFSAHTLEPLYSKALPLENHENGAPWCAADSEKGVIYSARRDRFVELNAYDPNTLELLCTIPVTGEPHKIQGGEVYDGVLYCSASRGNQEIFAVNLSTGEARVVLERNLNDGAEGEGLTVLKGEDGAFFRVLDIATLRLGSNLRSYAFEPDLVEW